MWNRSMGRQGGELVGRGEDLRDHIYTMIAEGKMVGGDAFAILGLHLAARLTRAAVKSGGLVGPAVFAREYDAFMADCDANDRMVAVPGLPAEVAAIPADLRPYFGYDLVRMAGEAFGDDYAAELLETTDIAVTPLERARRAADEAVAA